MEKTAAFELYEKAALLYESFHELFKAKSDIEFFRIMAGAGAGAGNKESSGEPEFVQKLFLKTKSALPAFDGGDVSLSGATHNDEL